jgi:uncharacterized protein YecE (DUF72 family)
VPLLVGTSGWQYEDWRGRFYPRGLGQGKWLEHYAEHFATVELNNAFYRLPERDVFAGWHRRTPTDFVVAVKASRYLTHVRRLREPAEPVARLMDRASGLGAKLGPVLLQLPPTLRADPPLLADCLARFAETAPGLRLAVEPRHPSWWSDDVRALLTDAGAALCWADRRSRPVTPLWRTAEWGYLRLHEGAARPWPRYGRRALATWLRRLSDSWDDDAEVFVYFNNDPGGAALVDAVTLAIASVKSGRSVTRFPDMSLLAGPI